MQSKDHKGWAVWVAKILTKSCPWIMYYVGVFFVIVKTSILVSCYLGPGPSCFTFVLMKLSENQKDSC